MRGSRGIGQSGEAPAALRPRVRRDELLSAVGLGALLSTLLVHTCGVTMFQRFPSAAAFVGASSNAALTAALAGSAAFCLACVVRTSLHRAARLPERAAALVAAVLYVAAGVAFCYLPLAGPELPVVLARCAGVLAGLACLAEALAWGRALGRYGVRRASLVVGAAVLVSCVLSLLMSQAPLVSVSPLFVACAAVAGAVPALLARPGAPAHASAAAPSSSASAQAAPSSPDAAPGPDPAADLLPTTVTGFLGVLAMPALGLVLFAMIMSMRAELFVLDLRPYLLSQALAALCVVYLALRRSPRPLSLAHSSLLTVLAVAVLAFCSVTQTLRGGTHYDIYVVFVLYSVCAVVTLTTLVAVVHADEFPSGLVAASALGVFSLATLSVGWVSRAVGGIDLESFVMVATGLYATVLTLRAAILARASDAPADEEPSGPAAGEEGSGPEADAAPLSLPGRCDLIAADFRLTARERDVLGYLAQGHSAAYASEMLFISPNTSRTHAHHIYGKLEITSRDELLRLVGDYAHGSPRG